MSITARSFSIAVTVPLTTRPSKPPSAPPSDSSSIAAKSSRVGKAVVAIECIPYFIVPAKRLVPLVLWPIRPVRRMRGGTSSGRSKAETRAKQKGRDEFVPSRPALDMQARSEEHTSELQSLMRISYAVFCLKKKNTKQTNNMKHTNNE